MHISKAITCQSISICGFISATSTKATAHHKDYSSWQTSFVIHMETMAHHRLHLYYIYRNWLITDFICTTYTDWPITDVICTTYAETGSAQTLSVLHIQRLAQHRLYLYYICRDWLITDFICITYTETVAHYRLHLYCICRQRFKTDFICTTYGDCSSWQTSCVLYMETRAHDRLHMYYIWRLGLRTDSICTIYGD